MLDRDFPLKFLPDNARLRLSFDNSVKDIVPALQHAPKEESVIWLENFIRYALGRNLPDMLMKAAVITEQVVLPLEEDLRAQLEQTLVQPEKTPSIPLLESDESLYEMMYTDDDPKIW
ncbi:hypothetical protein COW46_03000 [Candidatus Gracilibacteria bacterium CG17_big_fil_post_rev_8_21_14_2_50_48_13]|nr:MAG: hypothetical protein COW46_03000 [Candidatus Gracilibacteria bacterium CG17_big_fil_post_rev_8_21_14_2_50_48_13]